jgi:hypothetical protein
MLGNQKNSCKTEQLALPNLKRSGFVQVFAKTLNQHMPHKTKCRCFFKEKWVCVEAPCCINKALWVIGAFNYHVSAA